MTTFLMYYVALSEMLGDAVRTLRWAVRDALSPVWVCDPLFSVQRWWRNGGRECGIAIALLPTPSVGTGPLFMARTMSALSLSLYHDRCGFNVEVDGNAGEIAERLAYRASLRAA